MDPLPLPSSLDEAEALVLALYAPASPDAISRTQDALQRLQRSPAGWQFAHGMLERDNNQVKFFGALTIIVKLNTESSTLAEDDAKQLLQSLIDWFLRSSTDGSMALVIRKLASAMVTFFIQFSHLWPDCVRHLLYCLDIGHAATREESRNGPDDLLSRLSESRFLAALWFVTALVEDVSRLDMKSAKYLSIHNLLLSNSYDVILLLSRGLSPTAPSTVQIAEETIRSLQAWVRYEQRTPTFDDTLTGPLRHLILPAMQCIQRDELEQSATEFLIDLLQNYSGFLKDEHYEALFSLFESDWSRDRYLELLGGDFDFALIQYGELLLSAGDAKVTAIMENTDRGAQQMLQRLCGLLGCNGVLGFTDDIFVQALEFWATFVETMTDTLYDGPMEATAYEWEPFAMSQVMDAVSHCCRKIQMVDHDVWNDMDSAMKVAWTEARKDVADFLQSVYALKREFLLTIFVSMLLQAIPTRDWAQIEAALFCIGAISDCVGDSEEADENLHKVFSSELFQLVGPGPARADVPHRLLQTSLSTIERYSDFFERHQQYLPAALELLFGVVGEDGGIGGSSSKSIMTLCSSSRSLLKDHVEIFLQHFQRIHNLGIDSVAEERIMTGVASIIQAIPQDDQKLGYLEQLLALLNLDAQHCLQLTAQPDSANEPGMKQWLETRLRVDMLTQDTAPASASEASLLVAERLLKLIVSLARGLQSLSDGPIDLDAEETRPVPISNERLLMIQNHTMAMINQLHQIFGQNGEVTETICHIFRAGFSETEQGPFVFPPGVVIEFLTTKTSSSPRIGPVIATACSLVSSLGSRPRSEILACLSSLLPWVLSILTAISEPDEDSDLVKNGMDFVSRIMSGYPEALLQVQPTSLLELFFMFALKVLDGKEPLSKASACEFWASFVAINAEDPMVQAGFKNAAENLGPLLSRCLIHNIGGNASRSELDKLSAPLRKIVVQHPRSKEWLESALFDPSFPESEASDEEKKMFLKKVMSVRGSRMTNTVVKDFWMACRGARFAYAS